MPLSRPPDPPGNGSGRRRSAAGLARVLTPSGVLTLNRVDGAFLFALRAALAMALSALPVTLVGRPDLAVYAMLGSFTTTFGRNLPYRRRARVLAGVAVAMTACVGLGSALASVAHPWEGGAGAAVVVTATAVVAGLSKLVCDATGLGGLGAVLLLFSFAVAANAQPQPGEVLVQTALAAAGAAVAWVLAMIGRFVHPDRPQRLVVAAALRSLADLLDGAVGGAGRARHRATGAVLQAYHSLGLAPPTGAETIDRNTTCVRLTDLSWSLLIDSSQHSRDDAVLAGHLRQQAALLTDRRLRFAPLLPDLAVLSPVATTDVAHGKRTAKVAPVDPAARRAWELVKGRRDSHAPGRCCSCPRCGCSSARWWPAGWPWAWGSDTATGRRSRPPRCCTRSTSAPPRSAPPSAPWVRRPDWSSPSRCWPRIRFRWCSPR